MHFYTSLAVSSSTELYLHSLKNWPMVATLSLENCIREPLASSKIRSIFTLQRTASSAAFLISPFLRLLKVILCFKFKWVKIYVAKLWIADLLDANFSSSHYCCNFESEKFGLKNLICLFSQN